MVDPHTVVENPENDVAKVLAAKITKDLHDRDATYSPVLVHGGGRHRARPDWIHFMPDAWKWQRRQRGRQAWQRQQGLLSLKIY